MDTTGRRVSYVFLCALPFLNLVLVGVRAFRIPWLHGALGVVVFAAVVIAARDLGAWVIGSAAAPTRRMALVGSLLIAPSAIMSLLWVGLGAPFQASTTENYMRYLVLLGSSILVSSGFLGLKQELYDAGERFYSTVGFASSIPAGVAYLGSVSMSVAQTMMAMSDGKTGSSRLLFNLYSVWEFVAATLTYVATAAFAASLGRVQWLGRGATRAYVIVSLTLVLLLVTRGISYPELSDSTAPWYTRPGFVAGIPAIPWILPYLLGVAVLRRCGERA